MEVGRVAEVMTGVVSSTVVVVGVNGTTVKVAVEVSLMSDSSITLSELTTLPTLSASADMRLLPAGVALEIAERALVRVVLVKTVVVILVWKVVAVLWSVKLISGRAEAGKSQNSRRHD